MKNIEVDEKTIALQVTINHRNFVVTVDKELFEKDANGKFHKCSKWDKDVKDLRSYLKPPKRLDII